MQYKARNSVFIYFYFVLPFLAFISELSLTVHWQELLDDVLETREKELNVNTSVADDDVIEDDDEDEEKQKVDAPELLEVKIAIKRNMPAAKENKNDSAVVVDDRDWSAIQHHISRKLRKNLTLVPGDQSDDILR